jgi:hypothetical protein
MRCSLERTSAFHPIRMFVDTSGLASMVVLTVPLLRPGLRLLTYSPVVGSITERTYEMPFAGTVVSFAASAAGMAHCQLATAREKTAATQRQASGTLSAVCHYGGRLNAWGRASGSIDSRAGAPNED